LRPDGCGIGPNLTERQLSVAAGLLERMSIAHHVAVVERLCGLDLPQDGASAAADRGAGPGRCGPGWRAAELRDHGCRGGDPALAAELAEEYECAREALAQRLTARWGEPQRIGLWGALIRAGEAGEQIPEPWGWLCEDLTEAHLWWAGDRWLALGVSRQGREPPYALLVVVTSEDPP
jgi:hypothetical protein